MPDRPAPGDPDAPPVGGGTSPPAPFRARGRWTDVLVLAIVAGLLILGQSRVLVEFGVPPAANVGLTILLIAATLWVAETVPLFVTSFLVLALALVWLLPSLREAGIAASADDFLRPFFDDTILLFLGGFVLSAALEKYHLDEDLARRVLAVSGGRSPLVLLAVLVATAGLSLWLSNTATAAMMLTLAVPLARGLPPGHGHRPALMLAVAFGANIGGMGTPVGTPPNAIALKFLDDLAARRPDVDVPSFPEWMLLTVPGVVVMLLVAWGTLLLCFRSGGVPLTVPAPRPRGSAPVARAIVVAGTLATVVGWITADVHGLSGGTVGLLPVVLFFGLRLLDLRDFRGLAWDVLFLMGGGICLGAIIKTSTLDATIVALVPVESSGFHAVLLLFFAIGIVASSLMSNTATANLLVPILIGLDTEAPAPLVIAVALACSLGMPLPISTPPNALALGSGEVTARQMLLPGLIVTLVGGALFTTVGPPWWNVVAPLWTD